jgi:glycosyltransferase involved in cell wall biosynthesis
MRISMVSLAANPLAVAEHADTQSVQVAELARELGRQGHQVTVHTRKDQLGRPDRVQLAPGVTVEHLSAGPRHPLTTAELLPHIAEFGGGLAQGWAGRTPDVVHAYGWTSGLATLAARDGHHVPVVQSYAGGNPPAGAPDPAVQARMERALGRSVEAITAGCAEEREELVKLGVTRARISVVPAGVDIEEFTDQGPTYPRGERARLLVLSGPDEDTATAVRALAGVPGAELVIAGGPAPEELETDPGVTKLRLLSKELGVEDRVIFLGRIPRHKVPSLLRSANVVLSLLRNEPYGLVSLEAMACGVPVVATRTGGHADTVIDGVTGILVRPGRPAAELARRLRVLLADPTRLAALGIAGADRARSRHSRSRVAQETATVYTRLQA